VPRTFRRISYLYLQGEKMKRERNAEPMIFIRLHHLTFQKAAVVVAAVRT